MNVDDASKINPPQSTHSTFAAKRIIIVDDDTQVRNLFRDLLPRHGYEVHEADGTPRRNIRSAIKSMFTWQR